MGRKSDKKFTFDLAANSGSVLFILCSQILTKYSVNWARSGQKNWEMKRMVGEKVMKRQYIYLLLPHLWPVARGPRSLSYCKAFAENLPRRSLEPDYFPDWKLDNRVNEKRGHLKFSHPEYSSTRFKKRAPRLAVISVYVHGPEMGDPGAVEHDLEEPSDS